MDHSSSHAIASDPGANLKDLRVREVNGHIESRFSSTTNTWEPLKFVSSPYLQIHGMATGLNYGQQAFEGFKVFRSRDGKINLFRSDRNRARFQHSSNIMSMPIIPDDLFNQACRSAVALNAQHVPSYESGGAMYVRPLLFGSSAGLSLTASDEYTFCVFVLSTGTLYGTDPVRGLVLDAFDRAAPQGVGHAKVGGNYAPVIRWAQQAKAAGYGITLHLDSLHHQEIDEFSSCAFIGVQYGHNAGETQQNITNSKVTLAIPNSACVINSVTCDSVQVIARSLGWNVEKRAVKFTELSSFDEVLGCGTSVSLVPIRSITRHKHRKDISDLASLDSETMQFLSDDETQGGPVYGKLLSQLRAYQRGDLPDDNEWLSAITEKDRHIAGVNKSLTQEAQNGITIDQMV